MFAPVFPVLSHNFKLSLHILNTINLYPLKYHFNASSLRKGHLFHCQTHMWTKHIMEQNKPSRKKDPKAREDNEKYNSCQRANPATNRWSNRN